MTGLLFFCLKIDQKTLAGIGAMAASHTGFWSARNFFYFFLEKPSENPLSQGYRVEGKTIPTLRKEEKP